MKLLKPKPNVLARLEQLEEDHFVSAGTHRLEGPKSSVRRLPNRQKVLVEIVRQKSRKPNGLRIDSLPGRATVHTGYADN
jgi:hypothetical protein